jgi:hypothetical protein
MIQTTQGQVDSTPTVRPPLRALILWTVLAWGGMALVAVGIVASMERDIASALQGLMAALIGGAAALATFAAIGPRSLMQWTSLWFVGELARLGASIAAAAGIYFVMNPEPRTGALCLVGGYLAILSAQTACFARLWRRAGHGSPDQSPT